MTTTWSDSKCHQCGHDCSEYEQFSGLCAACQTEAEEVVDGEVVETGMAVVPYTGEALALPEMTEEQLAVVLDAARQFERMQMRDFKKVVQAEILGRMDRRAASGEDGAWTIHAEGGWTLQGDSPDRTEYPVDELRKALEKLAAAGLIERAAIGNVIVPERYKVAKRKLDQLLKMGGVVKDTIEAVKQPVTRDRAVRVTKEVS